MAQQGRCSGCGFEAAPRLVVKHHRSCTQFADLYRVDPEAALCSPVEVYRVAHPVESVPPSRQSKTKSSLLGGSGPVVVEYWELHPSILEELQSSHIESF